MEVIVDTRDLTSTPDATVVTATQNRSLLLARLLDCLGRQTYGGGRFEIVLVDDGSRDATASVVEKLAPELPVGMLAMRLPTSRGPASARNLAWRQARTTWIAFTDDDCTPAPQWLQQGIQAVAKGGVIVVGRTIPDPHLPLGPFSTTVHVESADWLPACNAFYRRSDLEAVGGFDEGFPTPGGEDTDLAYRIKDKLGRSFAFEKNALVYHDVRASKFLTAARDTQKWVGIPRFFKLHPAARSRIHYRIFWKRSHPLVIAASVGAVLGVSHPAWLLLGIPWLRYRLGHGRPPGRRRRVVAALPGVFLIDLLEVLVMARGSIRNRTLVL